MTNVDYQPFDFRTAGSSDDSIKVLKNWLHRTSGSFHDAWESISSTSVQMECPRIRAKSFDDATNSINSECLGCQLQLGGDQVETLAYISCQDLMSFLGCVIGPIGNDIADRRPTSIEISICQMIFETLASCMCESWPGSETLRINVEHLHDALQRSRLFPGSTLVWESQIRFKFSETEAFVYWILPKNSVEPMINMVGGVSLEKTPANMRSIVSDIKLNVVCVLGETSMSMHELADLSPGDVIKLNQGIDEPLLINVDGKSHYHCWPGRIRNQQCVEISCLL